MKAVLFAALVAISSGVAASELNFSLTGEPTVPAAGGSVGVNGYCWERRDHDQGCKFD